MTDRELIAEIAIRCNDPNFQDFPENIYAKQLLKAKRKVAIKYRVFTRLYVFTKNNEENEKEDIKLSIPGFLSEYKVKVNKAVYDKKENDEKLGDLTYKLEKLENELLFNYYPRNKTDLIKIYYISTLDEEEDSDNIYPILPAEYEDEIINHAVLEMAKLGIARFPDIKSEGNQKYTNLIKLYGDTRLKAELLRNPTNDTFTVVVPKSVI